MGMSGGGKAGSVSEINVTPLIDVLLVLLIIFMVIVPVTPIGLGALLPQPPKSTAPEPDNNIVVQVLSNGTNAPLYKINETVFNKADIQPKLVEIFSLRQDKVMFVKGDPNLDFSSVAEVIDIGHQAGVTTIGLLTSKTTS